MPNNFEGKLEGFDELKRALETLGPKVARRIGGQAAKAGAQVILEAAQERTTSETIRRDLIVRLAKVSEEFNPADRSAFVTMRAGSDGQNLAHLHEFGTKVRTQTKTGRSTGAMPETPFMRPALDTRANKAIEAMAQKLGTGLEREAKKLDVNFKKR